MSTKEVFLEGLSPWGFRMTGGADVGHPLRISRVNPGSKAALKGVREGDLITSINGQSTKCLTNSESHGLLRTVKENLRLGLNEDRNVSPKRRSREITKQSISGIKKDSQTITVSQSSEKETSLTDKPTASKSRRQRRAKLKYHIKKMFGFGKQESPTDNRLIEEDQDNAASSPEDTGPLVDENNDSSLTVEIVEKVATAEEPLAEVAQKSESTSSVETGSETVVTNVVETVTVKTNKGDLISETIYDNLRFPNTGIRTCLKKGNESPVLKRRVNFDPSRDVFKSEEAEELEETADSMFEPLPEFRRQASPRERIPDVIVVVEEPSYDYAKERENCLNFIREERVSSSLQLFPEKPKTDTVVIYANLNSPDSAEPDDRGNVQIVVHEPEECTVDEMKEDYIECIKETVKFDRKTGKAPLYREDEDDYELCAVEVKVRPEEEKLRGFLENLDQYGESKSGKQACTCHPNPYIYYYPGRRYLEVISEETSDLSDPDKPWENSELIRRNNDIEGIPEDWFGSQDGIDTSWQDGKSLEEASDVPVVSDSHSDTDPASTTDDGKREKTATGVSVSRPAIKTKVAIKNQSNRVTVKEVPPKSVSFNQETLVKEVKANQPKTAGPSQIKSVPSKDVVKNVVSSYYNKQYSTDHVVSVVEARNKPPKHPPPVAQKEVKVETEPSSINDVELVYIDSSDSDVTSVKSEILNVNHKEKPEKGPENTEESRTKDDKETTKTPEDRKSEESEVIPASFADIAISNNQKLINELAEALQNISVVPDAIPHAAKARATPVPRQEEKPEEKAKVEYADKATMVEMDVVSLKELSKSVVEALPCGQRILVELGIDNRRERYDSCSDYCQETSEYSYSSGTNLVSLGSELNKSTADVSEDKKDEDDDGRSSASSGVVFISGASLMSRLEDKKWIGMPTEDDPRLLLCVSPSQSKRIQQDPKVVSELLDLHAKFVNRRGYHEKPASPTHANEPDLISIDSNSTKHDLSDYTPEILFEAESKSIQNFNGSLESVEFVVAAVTGREDPEKPEEVKSAEESGERSDKLDGDTSRLLELIQNEKSDVGATDNVQEPVSADAEVAEDDKEAKEEGRVFDPVKYKISKRGDIAIYEGSVRQRPKSHPPSGEIFRKRMYEEYMDKVAERIERRHQKVIKISGLVQGQQSAGTERRMENEFMERVKERMHKLGLAEDEGLPEEGNWKEAGGDTAPIPKHVKELMEMMEDQSDVDGLMLAIHEALVPEQKDFLFGRGVWSPAQTPEAERKKYSFTESADRSETREEKAEDQPVVWTPPSAGSSPTLERKFRTINFQSPTQKRKEYKPTEETQQQSKEVENEKTFESKTRLVTSTSENSTLSTQLRLPTAQNPTITLLQKAREGQLPKGAQYLEETKSEQNLQSTTSTGPDDLLYTVKQEHRSKSVESPKTVIELTPRKFDGIGPITREGTPLALRSEIKEDNQQRWYKRMYDSLHKAEQNKDYVTVRYKTKRKGQYPYISAGGYLSEPERIYDSDASVSKYATLDRRRIRNKDNDFTTSTMPRHKYTPAVKHAVNLYKNQPGRIEDYEPGHSSIAEKETKQWWDEVMDIFDEELNRETRSTRKPTTISVGKPFTSALKDTGYESDSTLIFKRREDNMDGQLMSPAEQKMAYKVIQKGGEVPLHGLRKPAPERPKESPRRYLESEVNIHYRSPIRSEAKAAWPEEELAQKQAEVMRRIYQEQRRAKYLSELQDMYSRRHTDNFIPSQKSPIPLNRYDDFPVEVQPPRPRDRTPEPKLVARALYNFIGQSSRELSFRRGDIIFVRRQIDKNWYEGEHNAMIGLFPFNYVEIIPYDGIRTLPKKATEGQARAKFNFQAQTHLELSLVKGELVLLTRRVDENWFEGRIGNRKGIFPVSYVEVLVEPGEKNVSVAGPMTNKPVVAPASHSVMLNGAKDLGQQHYQPPRPASSYTTASLPTKHQMDEIALVGQTLHIDTQSDPVPYRVLYNYKPQNDDELELTEGDIVYVMEKCDDGWYVGSMHNSGQFGTFPGNYVQRIQ